MVGIRIEAKLWPSVWASLGEQDGDPLFVVVDDSEEEPAVGLLTLELIQEWGEQVVSGDMEEFPYADLYILLPRCFRLIRCGLATQSDTEGTWLVVRHDETQAEMHRSRLN